MRAVSVGDNKGRNRGTQRSLTRPGTQMVGEEEGGARRGVALIVCRFLHILYCHICIYCPSCMSHMFSHILPLVNVIHVVTYTEHI